MSFEEEMEKFWKAFPEPEKRKSMESYPPYQKAIQAHDVRKASEIACSFFSGDAKAQAEALSKHGFLYVEIFGPNKRIIPGVLR
ncbi:MAG TPA: hypothetical protein VN578_11015 [Candidatus Binatia bacterium]|jgi:hypothetical protein|nr:hypothetical protein [Candidatus Binatia bacterium]